jgi:hypothetical protein
MEKDLLKAARTVIIASIVSLMFPFWSQAGEVSLAWDHSISTDVVVYRMYFGTAPRTYSFILWTGHSNALSVPNLPGGKWFFAVTARDVAGNESDFSNEVSTDVPAGSPALPLFPVSWKPVKNLRLGQIR